MELFLIEQDMLEHFIYLRAAVMYANPNKKAVPKKWLDFEPLRPRMQFSLWTGCLKEPKK